MYDWLYYFRSLYMKLKIMLIDVNISKSSMLTASLTEIGFDVIGRVLCDDDDLKGMNVCVPYMLDIDIDSAVIIFSISWLK